VLVNNELTTPRFTISKMYCVKTSDNLLENIHSMGTYDVSVSNMSLLLELLHKRCTI